MPLRVHVGVFVKKTFVIANKSHVLIIPTILLAGI